MSWLRWIASIWVEVWGDNHAISLCKHVETLKHTPDPAREVYTFNLASDGPNLLLRAAVAVVQKANDAWLRAVEGAARRRGYSGECINLVTTLLSVCPEERRSAAVLLQHPFITDD